MLQSSSRGRLLLAASAVALIAFAAPARADEAAARKWIDS